MPQVSLWVWFGGCTRASVSDVGWLPGVFPFFCPFFFFLFLCLFFSFFSFCLLTSSCLLTSFLACLLPCLLACLLLFGPPSRRKRQKSVNQSFKTLKKQEKTKKKVTVIFVQTGSQEFLVKMRTCGSGDRQAQPLGTRSPIRQKEHPIRQRHSPGAPEQAEKSTENKNRA